MATEKVSLSLEEDLLAEARAIVGVRSLSGYVNHALSRQLQRDRVSTLLAELDSELGPVDSRVLDEVCREWPAPSEANEEHRSA